MVRKITTIIAGKNYSINNLVQRIVETLKENYYTKGLDYFEDNLEVGRYFEIEIKVKRGKIAKGEK